MQFKGEIIIYGTWEAYIYISVIKQVVDILKLNIFLNFKMITCFKIKILINTA